MYEVKELKGKVDELRLESSKVDEYSALCYREARHEHTENALPISSCEDGIRRKQENALRDT